MQTHSRSHPQREQDVAEADQAVRLEGDPQTGREQQREAEAASGSGSEAEAEAEEEEEAEEEVLW